MDPIGVRRRIQLERIECVCAVHTRIWDDSTDEIVRIEHCVDDTGHERIEYRQDTHIIVIGRGEPSGIDQPGCEMAGVRVGRDT